MSVIIDHPVLDINSSLLFIEENIIIKIVIFMFYSKNNLSKMIFKIHFTRFYNVVCIYLTGDICPPGGYKQGNKCYLCPAGTYRPISGGVQAASCAPCQPGYASDEGSLRCTECPPGKYASKAGKKRCSKCPVGTYQDESGSSECKDCPGNDAPGSTSCSGELYRPIIYILLD